jgi:hypothetical protein
MHFAQSVQDARRRSLFQQVPAGAGAHGVEDAAIVVVNRQHQELRLRAERFHDADPFDARHAGKADIQQHHIGARSADLAQGGFHGAESSPALIALGVADQEGQPLANLSLVFDNGYANRGRLTGHHSPA